MKTNRILPVLLIALLISPIATAQHPPCCGPISPAGQRLASFLDNMDIESLWLANEHVNSVARGSSPASKREIGCGLAGHGFRHDRIP
jgi:hypothetical protein